MVDSVGYVTLTRQSGLMREMGVVANNIANMSTTGYRAEGVIFSEYVKAEGHDSPSVSYATASVRNMINRQGGLAQTGGAFDLAIEGEGYFLIETPEGERLTRAGHFMPNAQGDLVTADGYPVLDAGGAPIFIPQGLGAVSISADGTISAGGNPVSQVGVFTPTDPLTFTRTGATAFESPEGWEPVLAPRVLQGFLEQSNVDPVSEITRMIEVQRAYELGQTFANREDERVRNAIKSIMR